MRKITVHGDDDLLACEEHACVTGAGVVTATDRNRLSFTIHGSQFIAGGERPEDVIVRCRMDMNAKWVQPAQRLPNTGSVVGFGGILQGFEDYTPPNTTRTLTSAIVALDDITYIRKSGPNADSPQPKQSMRNKLRSRVQRYKGIPTCTEGSPSPSTSQKALGKRKAEESEEEVDDSVGATDET